MKTLISLIILLLVVTLGFGQGYNNRYNVMGNSIGETAWDIETTDTGNVVIGARGIETGDVETYLLFVDENGLVENEVQIVIEGRDIYPGGSNGAIKTSDGNYFIGGSSGVSVSDVSFFGVLVDPDGTILWQNTYENDFSIEEIGRGACEVGNGYIIFGEKVEFDVEEPHTDAMVIRLDSDGNELWRKEYGGDQNDNFMGGAVTMDGGLVFSGNTRSQGGNDNDVWIVKTDNEGNFEWDYVIDNEYTDPEAALMVSESGRIFLGGERSYSGFDSGFKFLLELSQLGQELNYVEYLPQERTNFFSIKETLDDNIIGAGIYDIDNDFFGGELMKMSMEGDSLWSRKYYSFYGEFCTFRDIVQNADGSYTAGGVAHPDDSGDFDQDTWVVKTDSLGCVIPGCHVSILEQEQLASIRIYPNPANEVANILIETQGFLDINNLEIHITDMTGRIIERLPYYKTMATCILDVNQWSSGMYMVNVIHHGQSIAAQRLMIE